MPLHACVSESESETSRVEEAAVEAAGRRKRKRSPPVDKSSETFLRSLLGKECPRKKKTCLQQFIEPTKSNDLLEYRKHYFELHKLDQDNYVFDQMKLLVRDAAAEDENESGAIKWMIGSVRACRRACKTLHNMGSARCNRLLSAAKKGEEAAPFDARFLSKPHSDSLREDQVNVRASVVSYLTSLYHSVAETLPDVRDSTDADEDVTAQGLLVDPYAIELGKRADAESVKDHSGSRPVQAKVKQAKPRKMKRGVLLNQDRVASDAADGLQSNEIENLLWSYREDPDDVILRTKQFMSSCFYSKTVNLYPRALALERLPVGIPAALADKRDVLNDFKKDVSKYLRLLRTPLFGLERAADWLEDWVNDHTLRCMITTGPRQSISSGVPVVSADPFVVAPNPIRLLGANRDDQRTVNLYVAKARKRITHQAAARAWALGVPWGEALQAATNAVQAANAAARPFARAKGKGKGKGARHPRH
ncbi:FO synthase subunit 1 [Durusdinium trenchii]|uniref:FO synthase subunit 1 n=1 Tax=Durusdinium trenchii TaxID=1381693 RepID=A0ABP0N201_9DINO